MCSAVIIYTSPAPRCSEFAVQKRECYKSMGCRKSPVGHVENGGKVVHPNEIFGLDMPYVFKNKSGIL